MMASRCSPNRWNSFKAGSSVSDEVRVRGAVDASGVLGHQRPSPA